MITDEAARPAPASTLPLADPPEGHHTGEGGSEPQSAAQAEIADCGHPECVSGDQIRACPEANPPMVDVPLALTAFVAGRPAPQGSKRGIATKHGRVAMIESSKNVKPWREDVRAALLDDAGEPRAHYDGAVRVQLTFVMPRPKSMPKSKTPPHTKKPDIDKLVRAVLDAITSSGVLNDDSQVTHLTAMKATALLGETPGCRITISEAT